MEIIKKKKRKRKKKQICGYSSTQVYKYLGQTINNKLQITPHLIEINKKISFITAKMGKVRIKANIKTNVNLYYTFIEPHYNQAYSSY